MSPSQIIIHLCMTSHVTRQCHGSRFNNCYKYGSPEEAKLRPGQWQNDDVIVWAWRGVLMRGRGWMQQRGLISGWLWLVEQQLFINLLSSWRLTSQLSDCWGQKVTGSVALHYFVYSSGAARWPIMWRTGYLVAIASYLLFLFFFLSSHHCFPSHSAGEQAQTDLRSDRNHHTWLAVRITLFWNQCLAWRWQTGLLFWHCSRRNFNLKVWQEDRR